MKHFFWSSKQTKINIYRCAKSFIFNLLEKFKTFLDETSMYSSIHKRV